MWTKYQNFLSNNFFSLILFFAVIAVVFLSYNRFILRHDYIVGYEGVCDPVTDKCFLGVDDTSGKEYYYTKMQKYEPDLYAECGADITDCEEASVCLPNDRNCLITYCDINTKTKNEECAPAILKLDTQNNNNNIDFLMKDNNLQDNTTNNK
jgi:hypothetical protein